MVERPGIGLRQVPLGLAYALGDEGIPGHGCPVQVDRIREKFCAGLHCVPELQKHTVVLAL